MQRVITRMTCDFTHDELTDAITTHIVALDGKTVEIDVCEQHDTVLTEQVGVYVNLGRSVKDASAPARKTSRNGHGRRNRSSAGYDPSVVRAWGKANGYEVPERGRLSNDVVDAWREANPQEAQQVA